MGARKGQFLNGRMKEESARAIRNMIEVLAQYADAGPGVESICFVALRGLQRAVGVRRAAIFLFETDNSRCLKASMGISKEARRAIEEHVATKEVSHNPETLIVNDISVHQPLRSALAVLEQDKIRSLAYIPIVHSTTPLGAIMLLGDRVYDFESELEFTLTLGKLIAFGAARKRVEESLRSREEQFRAAFFNASIGKTLISVPDGRFLLVNSKLAETMNCSEQVLMNKTYLDFIHPDDAKESQARFRKLGTGEIGPYTVNKRYIRPDGSIIWGSLSVAPIHDHQGRVVQAIASLQDITESKMLEARLVENEARTYAMLESALDCMITIDHRGRILEFNHAAEVEFGLKREGVIGMELAELIIPPDLREAHREGMKRFLETGEGPILSKRVEMEAIRPDGTRIPVELSINQVKTNGPPIFTGFIRNITDRKEVQDHLRKANDELEQRVRERTEDLTAANSFLTSLIENIPDMIFVKEAKSLRFVRFNKAGETILGFSQTELIGKNDYDFFPKAEADFFTQKDRAVLEGKTILDIPEEPIHTHEHGTRILHTKKIPLYDRKGRPEYLLGISEDITERKQAEEVREKLLREREARLEAEKAVQIRDDFLSIASHELKTPLTPIRMYLQLASRYLDELESQGASKIEFLRKAITNTNREFERFLKLVENLLDVSRIRAGRLVLERSQVDLGELVKNVIRRFEAELVRAGAIPTLSIGKKTCGNWDQTRIEQVVVNLLTNAMKYGASKPIEIAVTSDDETAYFRVKDHGIGIAKSDQEKIFERFERVAPLKNFSGFGLGLFISREIVRAHGGEIRVKSELNGGSEFTVELPVKPVQP